METKFAHGARLVLGLIFLVFGLNGFFKFIPLPEPSWGAARFLDALVTTNYFMPFLKSIEVIAGTLLVVNVYVPLCLTVIAPIAINIFLFHMFLDLMGLPLAALIVLLEGFLIYEYRKYFIPLLTRDAKADGGRIKIRRWSTDPI